MARASRSLLPTPTAAALAAVHVRPGGGLRLLLVADIARSVGMALGALMIPRLAARSDTWDWGVSVPWLEWLGALLGVPWGMGSRAVVEGWLPWALSGLGLATALTTLGCLTLRPRAMAWRRRLGLLALAEVLFLSPGGTIRGVLVTLWTGAIWVGTLLGGLALSREVARVTGEEGLEVDPARPRL